MNVLNVTSEIYGIVGIVWVGFHTIVGDDFRVTTPEHHTGFQSHIKALSLVGVAAVAKSHVWAEFVHPSLSTQCGVIARYHHERLFHLLTVLIEQRIAGSIGFILVDIVAHVHTHAAIFQEFVAHGIAHFGVDIHIVVDGLGEIVGVAPLVSSGKEVVEAVIHAHAHQRRSLLQSVYGSANLLVANVETGSEVPVLIVAERIYIDEKLPCEYVWLGINFYLLAHVETGHTLEQLLGFGKIAISNHTIAVAHEVEL